MDWDKKVNPLDLFKGISFAWIPELLDKWQGKLKKSLNKLPKSINPEFDEPTVNTVRYNKPIKSNRSPLARPVDFPCRDCLEAKTCEKACDLLEMDDNKLMDAFLKHNCCPDCGSDRFIEGPSGGAATNVKCRGCGHYFNFGLPLFIQRIHVSDGVWQKGFME
jgi:ribosomal protein S27E